MSCLCNFSEDALKNWQHGTVKLYKTVWIMVDGVRLQRKYHCSIRSSDS